MSARITISSAFAVAIALLTTSHPACAQRLWSELPGAVESASQTNRAQTLPDFIELAARLSPAVVNISSEPGEARDIDAPLSPEGDPLQQSPKPLDRFGARKAKSLGSGFIINRDGYLLTNDHVIDNAKEILVTTQDGRQFKGKLIGHDPKTDIALVKIEAGRDLPVAPLGDSDGLRVGEWVMAIGNPFGFDHSVTAGIVSAIGRFIPGNYDDFIQTDASINPGNSGGPLINLRGEVVGVNSAIYTRTGSSMGIGFAIPANLVKEEIDQLRTNGRVMRGWLGVYIQKVTPDIAESMGLGEARGALISEVVKDGPARAAGLQRGDIILAFDSKPIGDSQELPRAVGRTPVGHTVKLKVVRDRAAREIAVTIMPSHEEELQKASTPAEEPPKGKDFSKLGIYVENLTAELARQLGLPQAGGVVISAVRSGSAADEAGLRKRDVILEINRQTVADVAAYERAVKAGGKDKPVLLLVKRDDSTIYIGLKPEA
jgi:serine protease Do